MNLTEGFAVSYPCTQLFIGGRWRDASDGRTIPVANPASAETIGAVAHASDSDIEQAVEAARLGFREWRSLAAVERNRIMRAAAGLLRTRAVEISKLLTQEQGKPLAESAAELASAADMIEWFADEGMRVYGRMVPSRGKLAVRQMVVFDPVGPVAAFTPWNFPINQVVRKLSAALAAGCSVIVKAPEETPAAPAALVKAFVDAGLPEGTLGLLYGDPAQISKHLIAHPAIRKITFTGSTPVGKQLAALAGKHMKRVTMELGGHAPVIVAADADLSLVLKTAGMAKFRNAGQACISPTRFLVQEAVYDEFAARLAAQAAKLKVGDGLFAGTQMGPLANPRRIKAMAEFTADAVAAGAQVLTGGKRIGALGNFWQPTVIGNTPLHARAFNDEPFGPLAALRSFASLDEAIGEANRLPFGLAAYAFTSSIRVADQFSREIEAGMLWINMSAVGTAEMPFGGMKDSGYGSEGGPEALQAYLNVRTVGLMCV